jgi:LuxR family maltose regulon positive regulatory protein
MKTATATKRWPSSTACCANRPPVVPAPGAASGTEAQPTSELLTRKELQVLRLAAEGMSNDALAERLFVAETTVRTHLRNINVKLDTRSRVEAIAAARRLGLIG